MLLRITFLLTLCLSTSLIFSQNILKGIITDVNGNRLPFVHILINKNSKGGVISNINGSFEINHRIKITQLRFSYLGYENLILKAPFSKILNVVLKSTAYGLNEVTIIAGEIQCIALLKK